MKEQTGLASVEWVYQHNFTKRQILIFKETTSKGKYYEKVYRYWFYSFSSVESGK